MLEAEEEGEDGYESPDLEGARKKVFCRSTLQWRSPALTQVMHTLDRKAARRRSAKGTNMVVERRNTGIISSRSLCTSITLILLIYVNKLTCS